MDFEGAEDAFSVDGKRVAVTANSKIAEIDWASHGIDIVCCCTVSALLPLLVVGLVVVLPLAIDISVSSVG